MNYAVVVKPHLLFYDRVRVQEIEILCTVIAVTVFKTCFKQSFDRIVSLVVPMTSFDRIVSLVVRCTTHDLLAPTFTTSASKQSTPDRLTHSWCIFLKSHQSLMKGHCARI